MSLSIFLPTRKGSLRAIKKNTREFSGLKGGLLELKLQQLSKVKEVDEIVLSSNDEVCLVIGEVYQKKDKRIRIDERPEHLAKSDTDLSDLISHAAQVVKGMHILWTHVTSPFCDSQNYDKMIHDYYYHLWEDYDSLVSVKKFQNFLWDREKNDLINRLGQQKWPATQDLKPLYEVNNAVFIAPREIYLEKKDRLGSWPFLHEMDKIPSLDIDDEEDFTIAEAIYERINR